MNMLMAPLSSTLGMVLPNLFGLRRKIEHILLTFWHLCNMFSMSGQRGRPLSQTSKVCQITHLVPFLTTVSALGGCTLLTNPQMITHPFVICAMPCSQYEFHCSL